MTTTTALAPLAPSSISRPTADSLIEDVTFLLAAREHPLRITARLGFRTTEALARRLYCCGRADLVRALHLPRRERVAA